MDESLRPVRLRKVVLGFPFDEQKGSGFHFDMSLSYKLGGIINTYAEGKPTLVVSVELKNYAPTTEQLYGYVVFPVSFLLSVHPSPILV